MRLLVSGANGFVGKALNAAICQTGHDVVSLVRRGGTLNVGTTEFVIPDDNFASIAAGCPNLGECDVFVHLAARVHVMRDEAPDPLGAYRTANVEGSLNAAAAARNAGASRFVFVSSIKALGDAEPGHPWREDDSPVPADPYGISKFEAEQALLSFGRATGMQIVIIRPPLVYGPGVRANFHALMRAVDRGIPLPLGAIDVRRSMIYVGNLVDAIRIVSTRRERTEGIYHVTDGVDLTVRAIVEAIARALGRTPHLIPIPLPWLSAIGKVVGKEAQVRRLTTPLRLDSNRIRNELAWVPPWSASQGIAETVRELKKTR